MCYITDFPRKSINIINLVKDSKSTKVFDTLEWLATMCSHVPDRGEQMVRYYGHYSNVLRGKRQQEGRVMILFPVSSNPMESQGNIGVERIM